MVHTIYYRLFSSAAERTSALNSAREARERGREANREARVLQILALGITSSGPTARNLLKKLQEDRFHVVDIRYKKTYDLKGIRSQIMANWRMIAAGLVAGFGLATAFLFDPMRLFFVKKKIQSSYTNTRYDPGTGSLSE